VHEDEKAFIDYSLPEIRFSHHALFVFFTVLDTNAFESPQVNILHVVYPNPINRPATTLPRGFALHLLVEVEVNPKTQYWHHHLGKPVNAKAKFERTTKQGGRLGRVSGNVEVIAGLPIQEPTTSRRTF